MLVREGSASKNLTAILTGALREGVSTREMAFCSDDKHLADIRREGTIRHNLRLAVALGMDPVEAWRWELERRPHLPPAKPRGHRPGVPGGPRRL